MNATNHTELATEKNTAQRVRDAGFRIILIPVFGILVPIVTRMASLERLDTQQLVLSFLYTILISFFIWEGNRYLHYSLRSYFDWIKKPVQKVAVLVLSVTFYTVPITVVLLIGWYHLFAGGNVDYARVTETTLVSLLAAVFITHVYETAFMVKESAEERSRTLQLERAKAEAELEALKNQIDPHFIFNSLNTLSHLIEEDTARAKQFNDNLADVYRYILQNKSSELVFLRDEIAFLENYFTLLKIRFEDAVNLDLHVPEDSLTTFLIPPISLQLLAENAIKHNEFSALSPLHLSVILQKDVLVVHNDLIRKKQRRISSRVGLQNLQERYKLTTGKAITVEENSTEFSVTLPLLPVN